MSAFGISKNARISPVPAEPVEVWVGSTAPASINRTARMAEGWLASPGIGLAEATNQLNQYRQACAEHGRTPTSVAIRRDIFVGETSQAAQKTRDEYMTKGYRGFPPEAFMAGSVNEVAELMTGFAEAGYTDIIVRNMSSDQSDALATIERLADVKRQLDQI